MSLHATDRTSLCLNLRFELEPKYLTYPNYIHSFLKLRVFLIPPIPFSSPHFSFSSSLLCCQIFFFPRLPSEFSWMCLLFPPGNPVWVEFRDFGQLSGISGHLAIHLKQDGKFYTCLCPHADDASSTCRGYCTYPRSTGLQSVCYTGGLEENGNSSLFGKAGVTVSLLGSECALVLLCPSHRADFMNICSAACPRQNGLLHQQPNFLHSLNFWASQCSALYSVLSPLSACGDRRLGIPASF